MAHRPASLPAPELVAPVYSAPVRGDAARLSWQPVDGARAYDVQVSPDEDFGRLIVDERVEATGLEVRNVLHGKSGSVFWRVASVGGYGAGEFSEATDFFSDPQAADASYAGLQTEAGAQTPTDAASKQPNADTEAHFDSSKREYIILLAVIAVSTALVIATILLFEGLDGSIDPDPAALSDTTEVAGAAPDSAAAAMDSTGAAALPADSSAAAADSSGQ